jgi:GMP synthase-like glutamine amidotransferase
MRILVLQHLDVEHPGVFRELWAAKGHTLHTVEFDAGATIPYLENFDLMAVMGGPMDVWQEAQYPWLIEEKRAIREWVQVLGKPYLGICLGHQLLAAALGGEVGLMRAPEVGLCTIELTPAGQADPLFAGFEPAFETLQWHGAEVAALPAGGVTLAANAACGIQAMRWGKWAYGLQYHTEITPATVPDWGRIPAYRASLEAAVGAERANGLAALVEPRLPMLRAAAQRLDDNLSAVIAQAVATSL